MANKYATPQNVKDKLGYTLVELLNLPDTSQDAVVAAANQLMEGQAISIPLSAPEEVAARRLYRACLTANAQVDTGLRGTYPLPLKTATGSTDPNDPEFYLDIIGHAVNMVKWELLAARKGVRTEDDRIEYQDALRYFGLPTDGSAGKSVTMAVTGQDITGTTGGAAPRGASVVQIGNPEKTRERRERMSNADWQERF